MRKILKITILCIVLYFGISFGSELLFPSSPTSFCHKPLKLQVQSQRSDITQAKFSTEVQKAIDEWETRTNLDLFEIIGERGYLDRSGLSSFIIALPRDFGKVGMPGHTKTFRGYDGAVTVAYMEIYNIEPPTLHSIILHELAHSKGLIGHSDNQNDIMYPRVRYEINNLSNADIQWMLNYCEENDD